MTINKGGYCMNCAEPGEGFSQYETSVGMLEFCCDACWRKFEHVEPQMPSKEELPKVTHPAHNRVH